MLAGFQQYLVDKGFTRTCTENCGDKVVENYSSLFLSSYGPLEYNFRKDEKSCFWGLVERDKPPVMWLGGKKIHVTQNKENYRTNEDGYRILFSLWHEDKFDEIYQVFMSDNEMFEINCEDEKNITIKIVCK